MTDALILEAKTCNNCVMWLKHCKAQCCKEFKIKKDILTETGHFFSIVTNFLTKDQQFYLKIHGAKTVRNKTRLYIKDYEIIDDDYQLIFKKRCAYLTEDNLCSHWEDGLRPELCKDFNEVTGTSKNEDSYPVSSCLANYKKQTTNVNKQ